VRFLLVHSPLVGPATWRWVAEALETGGHEVRVPDLRAAAQRGDPLEYVGAARSALTSDTGIIVGHSGAGFFLPSIADAPDAPSVRLLFVDAGIPPCEGTATPSADFLDQLRSLAIDGVLPRWSRWWGEDVMEQLVPDDERRHEINTELPEVPLAFYETPLPIPGGWCSKPGGFVLLSEGYRPDAASAESLRWPIIELLGTHLDIVNHPDAVAQALARFSLQDR
jgi:hypothetical protein